MLLQGGAAIPKCKMCWSFTTLLRVQRPSQEADPIWRVGTYVLKAQNIVECKVIHDGT